MAIPGSASAVDPDAADRWWQDGVVYQVYPRSFADSNGDGVGDLPGLIDHLDHLAGGPDSLGVDAIWLSPIYPSPMLDGGYDVMDHTAVDPVFGTLADLDRLIEECHRRGLRVILDLVMNHTSDQHPWFVQSRQSRTGPFADFYLWRDPSGWDRDGRPEPPNNWLSWFGGSAWAWEPRREQFYLHTFLPEQPDVNWRCPALRAEMWSMVRGWLDRGVDGFRLDVFNAFVKAADMPSNPEIAAGGSIPWDGQEHRHDKDQPELHELLAEFRGIVDARPGTATVGELFTSGIEAAVAYWAPRHLVFDWVLLETAWTAAAFRAAIAAREAAWSGRWPTIVLSNHDHSRHVSRYLHTLGRRRSGDGRCRGEGRRDDRADAARDAVPLLRGGDRRAGHRRSRASRAQDRAAAAMAGWWNRDGCRAPMAWSGDASGRLHDRRAVAADPAGRGVAERRASSGHRSDSVLAHYRRLLALRRGSAALRTGELALVDVGDPDVLAYLRRAGDEVALVVVRFGLRGGEIELPPAAGPWRVVLSSHDPATPTVGSRLAVRPLEALVLRPDAAYDRRMSTSPDVRHRPSPTRPAVPGRLRLGLRRLRLPDRGSGGRGRPGTVDLGHLRPPAGRDRRRQHGRRRLRPLPPLPRGRAADGRPGGARVSLQRQLVARPAHGDRRRQPARPRLLRAPRRRPARRGRPAADQPVPLGPAAGAAGPRRLRQPAGRGLVHRLRRAARVEPGRPRQGLDDVQRAGLLRLPRPCRRHPCAGAA